MIQTDEDALVCDLAETYHLYDYKQLPLTVVAVFAYGLRENSRIKMALSGQRINLDQMLLASMVDRLSWLVWAQSKDASKGHNRPKSILDILTTKADQSEARTFVSGEDFEAARQNIIDQLRKEETNGD